MNQATQRILTFSFFIAITAIAAAAFWFWALRPLGFGSYLTFHGATEAETIRQYWPHRLVQPEWVTRTPDTFLNWSLTETVVRSSIIGVAWLFLNAELVHNYIRRRCARSAKSP